MGQEKGVEILWQCVGLRYGAGGGTAAPGQRVGLGCRAGEGDSSTTTACGAGLWGREGGSSIMTVHRAGLWGREGYNSTTIAYGAEVWGGGGGTVVLQRHMGRERGTAVPGRRVGLRCGVGGGGGVGSVWGCRWGAAPLLPVCCVTPAVLPSAPQPPFPPRAVDGGPTFAITPPPQNLAAPQRWRVGSFLSPASTRRRRRRTSTTNSLSTERSKTST